MSTTNHPLTETAAELWDAHIPERKAEYLGWDSFPEPSRRYLTAILHATFEAGREHERKHADPTLPAEVTDEMVKAGHAAALGRSMGIPDTYRRIITAALGVAPPTDPHHDPRPWQDCTIKHICKGDLVEVRSKDLLHVGVAHHKDNHGDWWTEDGYLLTNGDHWPLRRIPAPAPPAEEVELPTEHPAHITDAEGVDGDWLGVDQEGVLRAYRPKKTPNE